MMGGEWDIIRDRNKMPLTITSDRGLSAVLHIFKYRYPSIAQQYRLGETLIAEPDLEATQRLEAFRIKQKEQEEDQIKKAWWQN